MAKVRRLKSGYSQCSDGSQTDRDPLIVAAEDWRAMRATLDAMILEWQGLEDKLSRKARELQLGLADACQGDFPEAQAMRVLGGKIDATQRKLNDQASRIRDRQGSTLVGAIAKVRLGLEVQGKYDWRENARELIAEGVEELNSLVEGIRSGPRQAT